MDMIEVLTVRKSRENMGVSIREALITAYGREKAHKVKVLGIVPTKLGVFPMEPYAATMERPTPIEVLECNVLVVSPSE